MNGAGRLVVDMICVTYDVDNVVMSYLPAAQRFRCPTAVQVVRGEPFNVSVCYLPYLPEAANLNTVTLVDEATGKQEIKKLQNNYCATYTVNASQPGSYHFQVSTGQHGHINSASFNVTVQGACVCT